MFKHSTNIKDIRKLTDPIEILRAKCLARGANGIHGLSRLFKIMDDNKNRKLDLDEFRKGVNEYGLNYSRDEIMELFSLFDKDKSGQIDFDEFLERLRVMLKEILILSLFRSF